MLRYSKVYIIGFMGSGKTTTGKKLASLLKWSFIDLDKKIEEHAGITIPEIFTQFGEEYFRRAESEILKGLKAESNTVISTGGGAPCHSNNMDFMLESGLTIYLQLTPDQLKSRLSNAKEERPLISNISGDGLQAFITGKLALREKYYNMALIHFNGFDTDYSLLLSVVKNALTPAI